ncbi:MAG: flagellar motor switch protein FliG [Deltaproteobacteria bacterium]|nr:flagellar motor switch protein FliG [Deltaproteobacteria bacterium]
MVDKNLNPEKLTGPQKAAIFLLAMGEEFTTSFFKKLDEKSIQKVGKYMSDITYVSSDMVNIVTNEFLKDFNSDVNLAISGKEFLQQVVSKTLDKETARKVFNVIGNDSAGAPFADLAYLPADKLFNMIKGEHPQTIALILSYLPHEKSAEILNLLPEGSKADIALRIVTIGQVQDELITEIDEALKNDISRIGTATRKFDGVEILASILNEVGGDAEEGILSHIEKEDSDLADRIRQKMFVFEDLLQVEDRGFREILQNVDNQGLAKALKTASEELKQKIFNNLSERAADMLKEDMEIMGPVRLKEVEEAQQNILRITKKLEAEGKIALAGSEDVFV